MEKMIVKSKLLASVDKELAFINEMNQKGYRLVSIWSSNRYRFQETEEEHFTIIRAVPKERVAELSKLAEENGYTCIPHSFDGMGNFLYLDGVKGISNEAFLSDEADLAVHKEKVHQYYRWTSVVMLLGSLFFLGWLFWFQMEKLPDVLQIYQVYGGDSRQFLASAIIYGVATLAVGACEVFYVWYTAVLCRLWYRSAKEKGKGKQALLVQVLLWLLVIPLLLGIYMVEKPAKEVDDEPTLEELREQAVLFEDYTHSTEKLGECYYFYGEFDSDLLFEDVKSLFEEKGYRLADLGEALEEGDDNLYYLANNDSTEETVFLVECTTEEEAKKVYTAAMEDSWEYGYRISANYNYTVTRMGRMVYGTAFNNEVFSDLMGIYDLPMPEPTPLYKGGKYTCWGQVGFEQAVTTAKSLNYTAYGYNELLDEAPVTDCCNFLTPDGRGYLSIVKLNTLEEGFEGELPEDDKVVLYAYQMVAEACFELFGTPFEPDSMKYVMLSKDTFIAGSSYYVDDFIAALETSTTFKPYAPSAEQLGERYYLYAEYESELLFAGVKPLLEAKGYSFRDNSQYLEAPEGTLYCVATRDAIVGEETERVSIFVMECVTEDHAKQVYNLTMALDYSSDFGPMPWGSLGLVRMGRMLYGTMFSDLALPDLLSIYDLPLPEASPLYRGGAYKYEGDFTFEEVVAAAEKAGYTFYDYDESRHNSAYEKALDTCYCLVSEDRGGYLLIGKLDCLNPRYLPKLFRITHDEEGHESMKHVMLSEDTFIAGTSYYVDAFIAELEN